MPGLSKELGAATTQVASVVAAGFATTFIAQIFTGYLADRYSKRILISAAALLGSLSSLLVIAVTDWKQLFILIIIGGIADAVATPPLLAITATLGKKDSAKYFGILRSSQGISFVLGPALGGLLSFASLRVPFILDGVFSLIACLAAFLLLNDHNNHEPKQEKALTFSHGFRLAFSNTQVYLFLLMGISGLFGFGIFYSFIPVKSQLLGFEPWQIGFILSGGAIVFSTISFTAGQLSNKLGRRRSIVLSQVIMIVGGVGLALSDTFLMLLIFYALFVVGEAMSYLLSFVYASDVLDHNYIGTAMGAFDSIMDLSLFTGPIIAVALYDAINWISPIFLLAVVPPILTLLYTIIYPPTEV